MIIVENQPEITKHDIKIQFMSRRVALQEVAKGICEHLRNRLDSHPPTHPVQKISTVSSQRLLDGVSQFPFLILI